MVPTKPSTDHIKVIKQHHPTPVSQQNPNRPTANSGGPWQTCHSLAARPTLATSIFVGNIKKNNKTSCNRYCHPNGWKMLKASEFMCSWKFLQLHFAKPNLSTQGLKEPRPKKAHGLHSPELCLRWSQLDSAMTITWDGLRCWRCSIWKHLQFQSMELFASPLGCQAE